MTRLCPGQTDMSRETQDGFKQLWVTDVLPHQLYNQPCPL